MMADVRLIDAIEAEMPYCPDTDYEIGYQNGLSMAKAIAIKFDTAPVVHGRWEPHPNHYGFDRCSACHDCIIANDWADGKKWNYCPHCGAKMDL